MRLAGRGAASARNSGLRTENIIGKNRFSTSALAAEKFFPSPSGVVLANGEDYPDALASGALAGLLKHPILLTARSSLPAETQQYLQRNGDSIRILQVAGGDKTLSAAALAQAKKAVEYGSPSASGGTVNPVDYGGAGGVPVEPSGTAKYSQMRVSAPETVDISDGNFRVKVGFVSLGPGRPYSLSGVVGKLVVIASRFASPKLRFERELQVITPGTSFVNIKDLDLVGSPLTNNFTTNTRSLTATVQARYLSGKPGRVAFGLEKRESGDTWTSVPVNCGGAVSVNPSISALPLTNGTISCVLTKTALAAGDYRVTATHIEYQGSPADPLVETFSIAQQPLTEVKYQSIVVTADLKKDVSGREFIAAGTPFVTARLAVKSIWPATVAEPTGVIGGLTVTAYSRGGGTITLNDQSIRVTVGSDFQIPLDKLTEAQSYRLGFNLTLDPKQQDLFTNRQAIDRSTVFFALDNPGVDLDEISLNVGTSFPIERQPFSSGEETSLIRIATTDKTVVAEVTPVYRGPFNNKGKIEWEFSDANYSSQALECGVRSGDAYVADINGPPGTPQTCVLSTKGLPEGIYYLAARVIDTDPKIGPGSNPMSLIAVEVVDPEASPAIELKDINMHDAGFGGKMGKILRVRIATTGAVQPGSVQWSLERKTGETSWTRQSFSCGLDSPSGQPPAEKI